MSHFKNSKNILRCHKRPSLLEIVLAKEGEMISARCLLFTADGDQFNNDLHNERKLACFVQEKIIIKEMLIKRVALSAQKASKKEQNKPSAICPRPCIFLFIQISNLRKSKGLTRT